MVSADGCAQCIRQVGGGLGDKNLLRDEKLPSPGFSAVKRRITEYVFVTCNFVGTRAPNTRERRKVLLAPVTSIDQEESLYLRVPGFWLKIVQIYRLVHVNKLKCIPRQMSTTIFWIQTMKFCTRLLCALAKTSPDGLFVLPDFLSVKIFRKMWSTLAPQVFWRKERKRETLRESSLGMGM